MSEIELKTLINLLLAMQADVRRLNETLTLILAEVHKPCSPSS